MDTVPEMQAKYKMVSDGNYLYFASNFGRVETHFPCNHLTDTNPRTDVQFSFSLHGRSSWENIVYLNPDWYEIVTQPKVIRNDTN